MIYEVAVLDVLLLAVIVLGALMWKSVLAKVVDREKAMDLHAKSVTRDAQRTIGQAQALVVACEAVLTDARALHQHVEEHIRGG